MRALFLLGRAVFGGFFLQSGLNHFKNRQLLTQYAASKGIAAPEAAVTASGALMVAGGLSVLSGAMPRPGLAALMGALIPMTLGMHRFWDATDPSERTHEQVNFMKNMALVGAAMMMTEIRSPWPASVGKLRAGEDMYLHLGNRDRLRLLA
jgi:putative oxidoreductase